MSFSYDTETEIDYEANDQEYDADEHEGILGPKPRPLHVWDVDGELYTGTHIQMDSGIFCLYITDPADAWGTILAIAIRDWKKIEYVGPYEDTTT